MSFAIACCHLSLHDCLSHVEMWRRLFENAILYQNTIAMTKNGYFIFQSFSSMGESQDKTKHRKVEDVPRSQIVTTRREALSLYREICRLTALFEWPNEQGVPWQVIYVKG